MFYSHELLGKKSPLGAIWIAAHGKKLNRNSVMKVNVADTCDQIINPEVPHALRLQGILIGGIVIVFNKQQSYLLEDCSDALRKVRAMTTEQNTGNKVLEKGRQQARLEAITVPDLDAFFGGHLNISLMNPLGDHLQEAPLGDDLFVMPTLPEASDMGVLNASYSRQRGHVAKTSLPLTMAERNTMILPSGLEPHDAMMMEQEETFMMPELGMEIFDTTMPLASPDVDMPPPELPEKLLPGSNPMLDPPFAEPELPVPMEAEMMAEPVPEEVPGHDGPKQQADLAPLEAVAEEQAAAETAAKQAKAKGQRRKRAAPLVTDDADDIQISGTVFRGWTQNTADLIQVRPHSMTSVRAAAYMPGSRIAAGGGKMHLQLKEGSLFSIASGHAGLLSKELQDLFASWAHPDPPAREEAREQEAAAVLDQGQAAEAGGFDNFDQEAMLPEGFTAGPDLGLDYPDQPANDMFNVEEEVEIERLRAALATPGSMTEQDHAKAVQLGLTPGSSNPLEGRGRKKQKRGSSAFRPDSDTRPTEADRSSYYSQRRLSDLMMGMEAADVGLGLEGHLEDLLPLVPLEPLEPEADSLLGGDRATSSRRGAGGLTQYQLMEDSAPATQTQKALTDAITKSTLSMIGLLRDRFLDLEEEVDAEPELSLDQMTSALTRGQAAKLFYQICVTHSNKFIHAAQAAPYGDVIITKGACL